MKKSILFAACAWLLCIGHAFADELVINNVSIPQGGSAALTVGFRLTGSTDKVGFTFSLGLPEGIELLKDEDGEPVYEKDASINKLNIVCAGEGNFAGQPANESATIKGAEGTLLTLTLKADAALTVGSTHTVNVTKATFQERVDGKVSDINLDDFSFTVTIAEPADTRTILDETSTTIPVASDGAVDVRVKRTIKAGEWSTICLPFAMTTEQVKAAFGTEVKLGDFQGYDVKDEGESIAVKFTDATAIAANHPYIIQVQTPVTEFTVDGVVVSPEEEPMINFGTKRKPKAFVGTYVAGTVIENGCLFLSDNLFWYSVGSTKCKGYRGYFNFDDLLPDFENNYAEVRAAIVFVDSTTGVDEMANGKSVNGKWYDLSGRRVTEPQRGIYIVNGSKVVK